MKLSLTFVEAEQMFDWGDATQPAEVASLRSVKIPFLYPTIKPPHFYHKHTNYLATVPHETLTIVEIKTFNPSLKLVIHWNTDKCDEHF